MILNENHFSNMAEKLRWMNPELTAEQARKAAVDIGDTPDISPDGTRIYWDTADGVWLNWEGAF